MTLRFVVNALRLAATGAVLLYTPLAWAQPAAPDAGRLLQENAPAAPAAPAATTPRATPPLALEPAAPDATPTAQGGVAVMVREVRIEGLSALYPVTVLAELPDIRGQSLDLAGLRQFTAHVQATVRARGLPFATAYLPPQDLEGGLLRVQVAEGRYGQVQASGDIAGRAQAWLAPLRPGQVITLAPLERSLLLLGDLPGVQVSPVLRPGAEPGTGDLEVQVSTVNAARAEVVADNHGDRYSGRERLQASIQVASPFTLGDQLTVNAQRSSQRTQVAAVAYSLPLGTRGLRADVSWLRTEYRLGKDFESLDAQGTARAVMAGLSYPLLRSQDADLRLGGTLQDTRLQDERGAAGTVQNKHSKSLRLSMSGSRRDERSVTWGSVTAHLGELDLDEALAAQDAASARTAGFFTRYTLEAQRLQALAPGLQVYGRLSAQWAPQNLDASERFSLGGATKVRAWPTGEATGDQGALLQLEARWPDGSFEPYGFYDAGRVRINRASWQSGRNVRSLAGYGLGLRWHQGAWRADVALARRAGQGVSETEPQSGPDRVIVSLAHRF